MDSTLVTTLLQSLITTNASSLEIVISNPPIASIFDSLLQFEFTSSLSAYSNQAELPSIKSPDRELLLKVILRLGEIKGIINLPRFALILASYGRTNYEIISVFVEKVLELDVGLFDLLQEQGPPLLVESGISLQKLTGADHMEGMKKAVSIQCALARSSTVISSVYGQDAGVLATLSAWYASLNVTSSSLTTNPSIQTITKITLKLEILETVHCILNAAFMGPLSENSTASEEKSAFLDELEEILKPFLELEEIGSTFLCDKSLWSDLEYYYKFSASLETGLGEKDAWRAKALIQKLQQRSQGDDGLDLYLHPTSTSDSNTLSDITASIKQILDVFPDQESEFIKSCLLHPRFNGNAETVLSALLEDDLPVELTKTKKSLPVPIQAKQNERRNIFDDVNLDSAKLSRGKTATIPSLNNEFMTDSIKAAIIARAEEESSDEGEEGEAFLEDFDDGRRAVYGVRDGEAEGDDEEERIQRPAPAQPINPSNPITPALSSLLNAIYLATPDLFSSTSAIRRSKARIDLKLKTGLDDQQLEGWRIMLDRNPSKTKILSQHEIDFAGNHHPPPSAGANSNGNSNSKQEQSNEGGSESARGGRGGRGRGGANRGRGDGGKAAHQRRQRGNDRKMSKVA